MALEVWVGTEVTVAKLQKVIDRASTEHLMSEVLWNGKRSLWGRPNIRKGWESLLHTLVLRWGVLFWKYHWDSNGTFQDRYPELFRFARDKEALVSDYFDWVNG